MRALVWRTAGDDKVCGLCAALEGKVDGDGWSSKLGHETDRWKKNKDGEYEREAPPPGTDPELVGAPPLHPNCRCSVIEEEVRT